MAALLALFVYHSAKVPADWMQALLPLASTGLPAALSFSATTPLVSMPQPTSKSGWLWSKSR